MASSTTQSGQRRAAPPQQRRRARAPDTLYFSYGSNLHLAQMAKRCPESVFKGKAVLPGHRWQINQRGVANVIKAGPDSVVEGLLFAIRPKDERSLDRSEGVSRGFYQKHLMRMTYEPHPRYANLKTADVDELLEGPVAAEADSTPQGPSLLEMGASLLGIHRQDEGRSSSQAQSPPEKVKALVYVSENYTEDGVIREEYIGRMQSAITHAVLLGISPTWIEESVVPQLSRGDGDIQQQTSVPASGLAEVSAPAEAPKSNPKPEDESQRQEEPAENDREDAMIVDIPQEDNDRDDDNIDMGIDGMTGREDRPPLDCATVELPDERLKEAEEKAASVKRDDSTVYVVVSIASDGAFRLMGSTHKLSLANQLAIACFKNACSQFRRPETEEEEEAAREMELDEGACLRLQGTDPRTKSQVRVWVEKQTLLDEPISSGGKQQKR